MATVSEMDNQLGALCRAHITKFLVKTGEKFSASPGLLLEIGVQDHFGARDCFTGWAIDSFDIKRDFNPTFVGDITKFNADIPDNAYDAVVCMDVLEHTLDPFGAVKEMRRILKDDGFLLVSAPLNFRIHGPIPDCWRFTEHGFKVLLQEFRLVELDILETPGRDLFPIHYNILAKNVKGDLAAKEPLSFRFIT